MNKHHPLRLSFKTFIKNPFFAGSLIMVIGTNLHNFGQFAFHFLAGRFLGRVQYGDLAVIISILGLVSLVQMSLGLTIVKFIAGERNKDKISNFSKWVYWWTVWVGAIIAILTLILTPLMIRFLNISYPLALYFLSPILLLYVLVNTGRSILQGTLAFGRYVISLVVEVGTKIVVTFILIFLGYRILGAVFGLIFGVLCSLVVTRASIAHYLSGRRGKRPNVAPLFRYSVPVFIQGLALTSMYSTDLILVKHFFSSDQAGIYASLAVLGRIVFFIGSPITNVMFPLVARKHSHGEPYHNIFYLSLVLVLCISLPIVLFYFLFPKIPLGILYGPQFLDGAPYLWWFGIFMGLLGASTLFVQFYLSIGKTKIVSLFVLAAVLQFILIWFIHPNLLSVIQVSIISAALLFLGFLIYFPYHHPASSR